MTRTGTCSEVEDLVDALVDGELDDARARAVRGHLRGCARCAQRVEATEALTAAARELGALDPPPSLWAALAERVDGDEIAYSRRSRWWWRWQAWRRPILGSVAVAAVAGALLVAPRLGHEPASTASTARPAPAAAPAAPSPEALYEAALREVASADEDYRAAVEELRAIVRDERARWRPEVARAFDVNLAAIDQAIERQRAAARSRPDDLAARDALHAGYKRQIDFLQEAVVRGGVP